MRLYSSAATDAGGRPHNEDAFLDCPELGLWAVADGAGGHAHGAAASRAVVAALETIPPGLTASEMLAQVRLRLACVHAALLEAADAEGAVMASTAVVLIVRGTHFACLWAGDSRAYRLRDSALDPLTRDHSLVQEMLEAGTLTEAEAETHPRRNVITRAIGGGTDVLDLDKVTGTLHAGDRFLLCSDGLCKAVPDTVLAARLADGDPAGALLAAALESRPSDNVTAVVVEAIGTGAATPWNGCT